MSSLWSLMDAYFVTQVNALDGSNALFTGVTAVVGEEFDPNHVVAPFVLIRSYDTEDGETESPVGSGVWNLDGMQYPYEIVYYGEENAVDAAREKAKDALMVLRNMILADPCLGSITAAEDGETVTMVMFNKREVFVRGLAGQDRETSTYVCQGSFSFTVFSKV